MPRPTHSKNKTAAQTFDNWSRDLNEAAFLSYFFVHGMTIALRHTVYQV